MTETNDKKSLLAHMVYFALKDPTPAARQRLVEACHKHLKNHPGVVFFGAGTLVEDLQREVNDRNFDVSLNMIFQSRKAHDDYQTSAGHVQFIGENNASWKAVRVFDSYVN